MSPDDDLRNTAPAAYEARYGNVKVLPTLATSVAACEERFYRQHEGRYVSYAAARDRAGKKWPKDQVLVFTRMVGGESECGAFLVDVRRYIAGLTPFGYVVDETLDVRQVVEFDNGDVFP